MLLQAGLADRVRVGASSPPPEAAPALETHRTFERTEQTPGAEETFSPDALLRPTSRAEGRLIELGGGLSSGKTALAYRLAALASARSELVGCRPASLDPRYLQRAGVRLGDVLWVRAAGAARRAARRAPDQDRLRAGGARPWRLARARARARAPAPRSGRDHSCAARVAQRAAAGSHGAAGAFTTLAARARQPLAVEAVFRRHGEPDRSLAPARGPRRGLHFSVLQRAGAPDHRLARQDR
jgi:hypothetical protein